MAGYWRAFGIYNVWMRVCVLRSFQAATTTTNDGDIVEGGPRNLRIEQYVVNVYVRASEKQHIT